MKNILLLWLCLLFSTVASAQQLVTDVTVKPCLTNTNSAEGTSWRWPGNSRVTVYTLRNEFAPSELTSIGRAIDNWNAALTRINVNVQFAFGGEREKIQNDEGNLTINRGSTYRNHRHLAEIYPVLKSATELSGALITIDAGVSDYATLTSVVTHEIGHSLGMDDCPKCHRGTTIMALYRGRNKTNDTDSPSPCDRSVVSRGYGK
jgi:hypothetical protein